jgi:hypothetical protein
MDQATARRRFGCDRHLVIGEVGQDRTLSPDGRAPLPSVALEEHSDRGGPTGVLHRIALLGRDGQEARDLGLRAGDVVIVTLGDMTARAYLDKTRDPPRVVGYFESLGRDPFLLGRPDPSGPPEGGPDDPDLRLW